MQLHQLRYFCAVAHAGSFTRAAETLQLAQPSLSQQIGRLERELGLPLFERLGRGLRLTAYGRALLPQAEAVLLQIQDARHTVEALHGAVRGRLAVGCIPTIAPYYFASRVVEFAQRHPDVALHLVEDTTPRLVALLQSGELDVAITSLPVRSPDLICSELFREPILVVVAPGHPLAGRARISAGELRQERLLLLREGHCFRHDALAVCRRARLPLTAVFETDQFASIFALVAAGFGISLVPAMAAQQAQQTRVRSGDPLSCAGGRARSQPSCVVLPLEGGAMRRVGYLQLRRHVAGPAQQAFIHWLRTQAKS